MSDEVKAEVPESVNVPPMQIEKAPAMSLFIEDNATISIDIDVFTNNSDGTLALVRKADGTIPEINGITHNKETFVFDYPKYDQIVDFRSACSVFVGGSFKTDQVKFRHMLILNNLRDWTLKDKEGNKIKIDKEVGEMIGDETIKLVTKLPSGIWDVVMTNFEKKLLLA